VADLGIAHLTVREAYGFSAGYQGSIRILLIKGADKGDPGMLDRIAGLILSKTPSIHNDQDNFFLIWHK